ncbi:aldose epimerase family protein [Nesterenkonia populi]|uniref:aldose epimerase family protein n=1 Tax=Nesterenkonia populi TaxID=1591087 RepID=UPI0011BF56F8|nr:aldose epimerase [Nesterenkonia populi]
MSRMAKTVTITSGDYTAEVGLRGGQLLSLSSGEDDLVVPAESAQGAFAGAPLAPWPNRVAGAKYLHEGQKMHLDITEPETGSAIHGLLSSVRFDILLRRASEVHLRGFVEPTEGYPFPLEVVLVYRVGAGFGLAATLMARYTPGRGRAQVFETAPFGVGFHPYLTAGGAPLKECRLRLPARSVAKTKPSGKVVDRVPVSGDLDLSGGPLLTGRSIDHAYTGLPSKGWTAELTHGPSGFVVRLISDTPWAQVYTGDQINRAGVAVEPMTCPPNAFNSGEDVAFLSPGQWTRTGYSIEAIRR